MSKELIERLRADAESTDDIGLCADAADRIEELERKVASRDAEVAKLKDDNEYLYVAAIERDQLRAKNDKLQTEVDELAVLVSRLARMLKKVAPNEDLYDKATDYLKRTGRIGSPLREVGAGETADRAAQRINNRRLKAVRVD